MDAVELKQLFDAQLLKANTDAAEFKAQFDKASGSGALKWCCVSCLFVQPAP